ncbi:unnamed protein product [marine sediment metagenome]|uniref:Uncharacterized protein n=1 Tax=marine sediment metagenome TaxID=412755 RepID=X0WL21_9ZZZZ
MLPTQENNGGFSGFKQLSFLGRYQAVPFNIPIGGYHNGKGFGKAPFSAS